MNAGTTVITTEEHDDAKGKHLVVPNNTAGQVVRLSTTTRNRRTSQTAVVRFDNGQTLEVLRSVLKVLHNHTSIPFAQIAQLPLLATTVSNWRQRNIELREHPTDPNRLISIGTTFDNKMVVVADEQRGDWIVALEFAQRGKVYVSK